MERGPDDGGGSVFMLESAGTDTLRAMDLGGGDGIGLAERDRASCEVESGLSRVVVSLPRLGRLLKDQHLESKSLKPADPTYLGAVLIAAKRLQCCEKTLRSLMLSEARMK